MAALRRQPSHATDGWVLYHDPQGYPYYHHSASGQSIWAQPDATSYDPVPVIPTPSTPSFPRKTLKDVEHSSLPVDTDESSTGRALHLDGDDRLEHPEENLPEVDSDQDDDGDDESSDDDFPDSDSASDDPDLEDKFLAMLATPEGQAALQAETRRVERLFEKGHRNEPLHTRGRSIAIRPESAVTPMLRNIVLLPIVLPWRTWCITAGWLSSAVRRLHDALHRHPSKKEDREAYTPASTV